MMEFLLNQRRGNKDKLKFVVIKMLKMANISKIELIKRKVPIINYGKLEFGKRTGTA